MMETVRLRLEFDQVLSKSQKTLNLKRCWILLKPQHRTISDLSDYLLHAFDLQNDCPNGLLLSMEGFALPPFESTSMFKDKDIIRVEKNGSVSTEIVMVGDEANSLEVVEILERQPVVAGMNLLANEEFEKECGGYQSEEEEDEPKQVEDAVHLENSTDVKTVTKKRKASKELRSPKRKKKRSSSDEKRVLDVEDNGNIVNGKQNGTLSAAKVDERIKSSQALPTAKRLSQHQENGNGSVNASPTPCQTKKLPSRSARRKKAKRIYLRRKLKAEREELQRRQLHGKPDEQSSEEDSQGFSQESDEEGNQEVSEQVPERETNKLREDPQQPDPDGDEEEDVVPIVIRPGHIRFEPLSTVGSNQAVQQNQIPLETFRWNGITSKKKGQKWGKEKTASWKGNNYKNVNQECSKMLNIEARPVHDRINFEKLEYYTTLPKEGDVIAYRLLKLSSSWTPELSSYGVGKISRYEIEKNRVRLVPVRKHPMIPEEETGDDASGGLSEAYPCARDGSLWIDFSSLCEVRLVSQGDLKYIKSVAAEVNDRDQDNISNFRNDNENHASVEENGAVDAWEQINQALNAKKAELSQEDNWNKTETSGRRPWSYKALRGSALGPTMALLRAQNEL